MSRSICRLVALTLLVGTLSLPLHRATAQRTPRSTPRVVGWSSVPAILARIKAPKFPARDFNITSYGAVADGKSDSTEAIRRSIAACNTAGGGRVVVPAGVFLTGAIHLKSNVNLY